MGRCSSAPTTSLSVLTSCGTDQQHCPGSEITGIKLANQSLPADSVVRSGVLELTPKENSVTIEFAGLQYAAAYLIRYRLEGLDKEWRVADRNFQAVSPTCRHGYTLELQSAVPKPARQPDHQPILICAPHSEDLVVPIVSWRWW